jgi:biotin transport system permease protein
VLPATIEIPRVFGDAMITYEHDRTLLHRLDPRSKLLAQFGFAIAALAHTSVPTLGALTALALAALAVARLSPVRVLRTYWFVLVLLAMGPVFASLTLGPPWVVPEQGVGSVISGYRVVLVLCVSAAYVRTTPVRETRAAIQRHAPGRLGQLLGVGVALVFRFFPVLLSDLRRARLALRARAGEDLGTVEWLWRLALSGLTRAFERAETLSLALRARCFAWNPTLPHLQFSRVDYPVLAVAAVLALSPLFL